MSLRERCHKSQNEISVDAARGKTLYFREVTLSMTEEDMPEFIEAKYDTGILLRNGIVLELKEIENKNEEIVRFTKTENIRLSLTPSTGVHRGICKRYIKNEGTPLQAPISGHRIWIRLQDDEGNERKYYIAKELTFPMELSFVDESYIISLGWDEYVETLT